MAVSSKNNITGKDVSFFRQKSVFYSHPSNFPVEHALFPGKFPCCLCLLGRLNVPVGGDMIREYGALLGVENFLCTHLAENVHRGRSGNLVGKSEIYFSLAYIACL